MRAIFKHKSLRTRNYILVGGSLLVLAYLFLTDPNGGALTATFIGQLATPIIAVWFSYISRIALFDYIDMEELWAKAKESSVGSSIAFLGLCLVIFGLLGLFGSSAHAQDVKSYIPQKAYAFLPIVKAEQQALWMSHPKPIS